MIMRLPPLKRHIEFGDNRDRGRLASPAAGAAKAA
jgi:hypothetical protein